MGCHLCAQTFSPWNARTRVALPGEGEQWSLTTLCEKLIKIGARVVKHNRYVTFQLAQVAIPRTLSAEIIRKRIRRGAFKSLAELEQAIYDYLAKHDQKPVPFVCTATAKAILEKAARAKQSR